MDVYNLLHDLVFCNSLTQCGQILTEFADVVSLEKNKAALVKQLYQQIASFAFSDYIFDDENSNYVVLQEDRALAFYLNLRISPYSSPVKSLKAIRSVGQQLITEFVDPVGKIISKKRIDEIMKYLDDNYTFSQKVFSDRKAAFLILGGSNKEFDSECFVGISENEIIQHLFLYHMKEKDPKTTPEWVLFHELWHALHARYAKSIDTVPDNIVKLLSETFFPNYKDLTTQEQKETLADILGMGLMFKSPFSQFDPFSTIDSDGKEFFNLMVKKITSKI